MRGLGRVDRRRLERGVQVEGQGEDARPGIGREQRLGRRSRRSRRRGRSEEEEARRGLDGRFGSREPGRIGRLCRRVMRRGLVCVFFTRARASTSNVEDVILIGLDSLHGRFGCRGFVAVDADLADDCLSSR